ncbi:MAG: trypsin-like peptidase domain-containing protein [Bacteroidales bacterium]|nr:trypsin-like peptidase domain-containing protein [Bacteroidales bacterium]
MKRIILYLTLFLIVNIGYCQLSTKELPVSFSYNKKYKGKVYEQSRLDLNLFYEEDEQNKQDSSFYRFGYKHKVNYSLDNSGEWITLDNGDRLWRLEIYCPEALSINLLYDKFWLPDGAKLFVYSADKRQAIGAFTSANNKGTKEELRGFATDLIYSDDIFIEYYVPKGITDIGMISIAYIIHGYTYVLSRENYEITSNQCQVNINCLEGMNWQNEKNAVVKIIVGEKTGSGFLINTTANDNRPYLLTADHCIENGHDALTNNNLDYYIFWWNYESENCENPQSEPEHYSTVGATILANKDQLTGTDFALLSLIENPKNNPNIKLYYLGWDRSGFSTTNCVGIHHPKGDIKKISTAEDYTTTCTHNGHNYFWQADWVQTSNGYSSTQIGSSGSPLLNKNRHVIGQLTAGVSANCLNLQNDIYSIYGKFNLSWTGNEATNNNRKLQPWLDPNNTGATTLDGIGNVSCQNGNTLLTNHLENDLTISTPYFATGLVYINSGVTLTLTSTLRMAPGSRIIVRPGAKLVVNGGEIVGACGEYWDGIRVEGNKNLPQTETNQGVVELNNALISDAIDGISAIGENENWEKTGGIIKATNTTFKNNRRSIEFMSYGEGSNVNNVSYFRNCTFTWDDDLLANESTSLSHITMYQVRGVEVSGCTFKDERTDIPSSTHGLLTLESGFNVNNYNTTDAQFNNLTFGIKTDN